LKPTTHRATQDNEELPQRVCTLSSQALWSCVAICAPWLTANHDVARAVPCHGRDSHMKPNFVSESCTLCAKHAPKCPTGSGQASYCQTSVTSMNVRCFDTVVWHTHGTPCDDDDDDDDALTMTH